MASDSDVLVRIVKAELGHAYVYHCCNGPRLLQLKTQPPSLSTWLQLFFDVEMGSRAERMIHGGGWFHAQTRHWHAVRNPVPELHVTTMTTVDELATFMCHN
eukprot:TRINITY_DN4085_c0_g1_i1.p4 TRINITY_DN4085_c0_g1~~TRINITY_DN4085_c0_g1_i1.p4  ORF type:complete len:102 (+),score=15.81 TRINITY_DN4085_c0_g1_i1:731-1036(+)